MNAKKLTNEQLSILNVCETYCLDVNRNIKVDFIGKSNLWIDNVDESSSIDLTRSIICAAISETAPGQLSIVGYDSDLSGVFAPFAMLSSGESKQLLLIDTEEELKRQLGFIRQQIQGVQNVIQGRAGSLTEFRRTTGRPIEGYQLIVLILDMGMIDIDLRAKIALLMKSGPCAGVSFLVVSPTQMSISTSDNETFDIGVEDVVSNVSVLEVEGNVATLAKTKIEAQFSSVSCLDCLQVTQKAISLAHSTALPVVKFDELHDLNSVWHKNTIDGVTFTIGKYGVNDVEITLGDEVNQRHNALITGAVGQGKSNLISVIIHSLCVNYSPKELNLYLLDFKEGVTFKAFSNIGKDDYLPHARALGLESDVDFGLAVLNFLFDEYRRRMALLKENGVKSIKEFREQNKYFEMPRIVVVIDEFQMMFGDDLQVGQVVVDLLEKSVRLFRAAGIHFILSSQTLSGNVTLAQKRDSIFSQVPVRIALKNSLNESFQTLSLNNPAAAFLRPREAIVNLDYGEASQNRKSVIAFADEKVLKPVRQLWWEREKNTYLPPYVFESERHASIGEDSSAVIALRANANAPTALIGSRISIDGSKLEIPLPSEPGRNVAIIGTPDSDCNHAIGMIQSAAISLAYQHPKGDARFMVCDFTNKLAINRQYPQFSELMENAGYFIESVSQENFSDTLGNLLEQQDSNETVYVFGIGMDRWEYEKDPYGQGSPLKNFVETGASRGLHFIGWWIKSSSFNEQVSGYGSSDAFNTKVFLRVDERTVQSLTSPFVRWESRQNRALASDYIEFSDVVPFVPYSPATSDDIAPFRRIDWQMIKPKDRG